MDDGDAEVPEDAVVEAAPEDAVDDELTRELGVLATIAKVFREMAEPTKFWFLLWKGLTTNGMLLRGKLCTPSALAG